MRADARRNRRKLLEATVQLILEVGGPPPLDAVARRAGVGIGTLYRRFPDRESLLGAAAAHVLDRAIEAAERALSEGETGHDAVRRYMHGAFDCGVGVLSLIHPLLDDPDWSDRRARVTPLLESIIDRCRRDGSARADLQPDDVVLAVGRFSRPVTSALPRDEERALALRQLDIYIDGLAAT